MSFILSLTGVRRLIAALNHSVICCYILCEALPAVLKERAANYSCPIVLEITRFASKQNCMCKCEYLCLLCKGNLCIICCSLANQRCFMLDKQQSQAVESWSCLRAKVNTPLK